MGRGGVWVCGFACMLNVQVLIPLSGFLPPADASRARADAEAFHRGSELRDDRREPAGAFRAMGSPD